MFVDYGEDIEAFPELYEDFGADGPFHFVHDNDLESEAKVLWERIVSIKFQDDNIGDCKTFIVLTLQSTGFRRYTKALKQIKEKGFIVWMLRKVAVNKLELAPIFGQQVRQNGAKDIVIISLDKIWNNKEVLKTARFQWGHTTRNASQK